MYKKFCIVELFMLRIFLKTIAGLCLTIGGLYIGYIYISGIDTGSSPFLLIPCILCVAVGVFLLVRAGKADDSIIAKAKSISQPGGSSNLEDRLKMNNEINSQWGKINDDKNKLRLLEIAANEQSS